MKKIIAQTKYLALALLLAIAACAVAPPTATINDKAAIGIQSVTVLRKAATALLVAKKITVEQDKVIQAQLDLAAQGIHIAVSLQSSDPTAATAQLVSALTALEALKTQTGTKP